MNISKYPHPWRSEKNAYHILLQRQKLANKAVNVQVGALILPLKRQKADNIITSANLKEEKMLKTHYEPSNLNLLSYLCLSF